MVNPTKELEQRSRKHSHALEQERILLKKRTQIGWHKYGRKS